MNLKIPHTLTIAVLVGLEPNYLHIGRFGKGCMAQCQCDNGATCDHVDGSCRCKSGYTGARCDQMCAPGLWGVDCIQRCRCKNSAECSPNTGECICAAGWRGEFCNQRKYRENATQVIVILHIREQTTGDVNIMGKQLQVT